MRLLLGLVIGAVGLSATAESTELNTYAQWVDKTGAISLPAGYRKNWSYLGSYLVQGAAEPGMSNNDKPSPAPFEAHTVFTQPASAEHYRQHGEFPDGAVLIKDVYDTHTQALATGLARYESSPKIVFVMVKDKLNRFSENEAWGGGWGWALFSPGDPQSQTVSWKGEGLNNCFGCHVPVEDQDWVYTQGYRATLTRP